jgi:hypothetical protein
MKRKVTKEKSSASEKLSEFQNNCYKIQTRFRTSHETQTANFIAAIIAKFLTPIFQMQIINVLLKFLPDRNETFHFFEGWQAVNGV